MPAYRVTGPDGKVYRVTPPAGTDPTPDEVLARVRAEVDRGTPAAPPSGPEDTPSFLRRLGQGYETGAQWLTKKLAQGIETVADTGLSPVSLGPFSEAVAETVVPQTPLQAGVMLGTATAGPAVGAAAKLAPAAGKVVAPWLARILGGTAGGAAGGAVGEEGALRGAAVGAGTSLVGEGIGAGVNKLLRSLPGMKRAINVRDVRSVGETVGEIAPPLRGARTAADLRELAAGGGLEKLGTAKDEAITAIEGMVAAKRMPKRYTSSLWQEPPGKFLVPTLDKQTPMTIREANDKLSEVGAKAFSKNPLDRTFQGIDQRRLYKTLSQEILTGLTTLDPQAAQLWQQAQRTYAAGKRLTEVFRAKGLIDKNSMLRMEVLQEAVRDPSTIAWLRNKLGPEGYAKLAQTVTRGGGVGAVDRPAWGTGTAIEPLRMIGEMKGGTPALVGATTKGFLPNLWSRYAGTLPFQRPQSLQLLLDLALERGTLG